MPRHEVFNHIIFEPNEEQKKFEHFIIKSFEQLFSHIHSLTLKIEKMANTQERLEAVLARIDAATNAIAKEVSDTNAYIKTLGLPASVEEQITSRLEASADKLEGIGKVDLPADTGTGGTGDTGTGGGDTGTGDGGNTGTGDGGTDTGNTGTGTGDATGGGATDGGTGNP